MADSEKDIIKSIEEYIQKGGGGYRVWYVGISNDARNRLFNQHNVRENGDLSIIREATSSQVARNVEKYFVNVCGTDGGAGGGDFLSNMVYAYKKATHTNP